MQFVVPYIALISALILIMFAARQMGEVFSRYKLPLISGFLFVGIIAGPFVLDFVHTANIPQFLLLDELALAFIAFAAGAEIELQVIRGYFRSIVALISGQVVAIFVLGIAAFFLLQDYIPFMADLPQIEVLAIGLLSATIMVARSPSSALAIIKELRARGPFTHKVLGATVLKDVVVIIIFAATVSVSAVLVEGGTFSIGLLGLVVIEIILDIALGIFIGFVLQYVSRIPFIWLKSILILGIGLAVFTLAAALHDIHLFSLPVGLLSEPLLICMTAGFYVTNYTRMASDFQHTIEEMSPSIFLLFFTLVGLELELDVIGQTWRIMLILLVVRLVGIMVGSYLGTTIARDQSPGKNLLGLGFITQAGVSVGLAKEIGAEFSEWGPELATLTIGVIVLNQIIGPPLLKWAIQHVGEAHIKAQASEFDGVRDAIIFGVEGQSLALARQLQGHNWNVHLVARQPDVVTGFADGAHQIELLPEISVAALQKLNTGKAESVVLMLSDEENLAICELIYEEIGVENVIVRLEDLANLEKFRELGVVVIQPGTAMVNLLDQFVRSPFAASLLLGMDPYEEFMEIEMQNRDFHGIAIRDIHFPQDVLILAISRQGNRLVSHGYTRLEVGDHITAVGSPDSLLEVEAKFAN